MTATVEKVKALANVPQFLKETGAHSTVGQCHNAIVWLCVQIKKAGILDYTVHLCTGTFVGADHSWIQIEDPSNGKFTIVDMTVDQFCDYVVPYVGPVSPGYALGSAVCLCDEDALRAFVESLGV